MASSPLSTRAEEHFTLTYSGPALESGRMNVQQLAPALIAFSRSLQQTHSLIDPLGREPSLDITATKTGSFAIDLVLTDAGLIQGALDLLAGREVTATLNLAGLLGILFGGYKLTSYLTRRITGRQDLEDGTVRITFDDGQSIIIPRESLIIAQDRTFREAARDVVDPLRAEGVDSMQLSRSGDEDVLIETQHLAAFAIPPAAEEELLDTTGDVVLRLATVAFKADNKWRVSDGESTFFATVSDQAFLDRVRDGERFGGNDLLRARMRTRQIRDAQGELHVERDILQVLEHIRTSQDVPLPFDDA